MAIKFDKIITEEIIHDDDSILTPLYGKIKVVDNVDCNKYTYFDTVEGYDLFVSETADDTLAVKAESEEATTEDKLVKDVQNIQNNYDVDLVKYDGVMSTIIIKVLENKTDNLDNTQLINELNTKITNLQNKNEKLTNDWNNLVEKHQLLIKIRHYKSRL